MLFCELVPETTYNFKYFILCKTSIMSFILSSKNLSPTDAVSINCSSVDAMSKNSSVSLTFKWVKINLQRRHYPKALKSCQVSITLSTSAKKVKLGVLYLAAIISRQPNNQILPPITSSLSNCGQFLVKAQNVLAFSIYYSQLGMLFNQFLSVLRVSFFKLQSWGNIFSYF